MIPQTLTAGGDDPLPHSTPSPAFGRAWGATALVLGPKPWSPSTFQPWLRPCFIYSNAETFTVRAVGRARELLVPGRVSVFSAISVDLYRCQFSFNIRAVFSNRKCDELTIVINIASDTHGCVTAAEAVSNACKHGVAGCVTCPIYYRTSNRCLRTWWETYLILSRIKY